MSVRKLLLVALVALAAHPAARALDVAGRWQSVSDDGTQMEVVELQLAGQQVRGLVTIAERGYFSGRTTVRGQLQLAGTVRDGALDLTLGDGSGAATRATGSLRGEYLVLRSGDRESSYARPGRSLVTSAEGSPQAAALARAIAGRVYASTGQAGGRGAFVGGRQRVAFCSDGSMAYDASTVASTPGSLPGAGVDMGSTTTRRGSWSIVLRAGVPVVRASWHGTGTSYSLSAYFDVQPAADGRGAVIDGVRLPNAGQC